ncbi:MAG: DNA cytosine methyltransferase [Bacteroidota bacterium]
MTATIPAIVPVEVRHYHVCCGGGSGAKGFNKGAARVGNLQARFRCIGGVDHDPLAIADFDRLAGAKGTVLDLFSREQYIAFHGKEPPPGWREATPDDIRRSAGGEFPHIVFTSMPCKGFSGLLAESLSRSGKYQALNGLTLRGVWLTLEAFADDPPELWIFENVPRIATRGRPLLDQIKALFRAHGYAVEETTHDCGEIGGLAESRKRFLLVARHMVKVPPFLYEPPKKRLKGVGEVLDKMPMPGDPAGGPMHRVPQLQWKTWVRLAFVEAGKDWRSLNRLAVEDGFLRDYGIVPDEELRRGVLGVNRWEDTSCTVSTRGFPLNGAFSVADIRAHGMAHYHQYGVRQWEETSGAVSGQSTVGGGTYAVADPRPGYGPNTHHNVFRVVRYADHAHTVTGAQHAAQGGLAVADPRPSYLRDGRQHYQTAGMYGVLPYDAPAGAVNANACHDNGNWSVADRRLPSPDDRLACVIIAEDQTWHRPFTTLELAALQTMLDPDEEFVRVDGIWQRRQAEPWMLAGTSDSRHRECIGNAVPADAAAAIASTMAHTLLLAWSGQTFVLSSSPIWVLPPAERLQRELAIALSVTPSRMEA